MLLLALVLLGQQPGVTRPHPEQRQPDADEHDHPEDAVESAEVEEEQLGHRCGDQRHACPNRQRPLRAWHPRRVAEDEGCQRDPTYGGRHVPGEEPRCVAAEQHAPPRGENAPVAPPPTPAPAVTVNIGSAYMAMTAAVTHSTPATSRSAWFR